MTWFLLFESPLIFSPCFLAYLNHRLKWSFLMKMRPLSVVDFVGVVGVVETFHIFIFLSRTTGLISTKLGTKHPWIKGIKIYSNEGPHPFPREDNYEIVKIHWWNLKIFSRTIAPISIKLCTKHPPVKGIPVCSDEGPHPFSRGENYEIANVYWRNLRIFSRANFKQTW